MSRIGKKIITIPSGVEVQLSDHRLVIKGPKGEVRQDIHPRISILHSGDTLTVKPASETLTKDRALWGTFASLLQNMVHGAAHGFKKQLEINGVGYKAALKGKDLQLEVGFTHPVMITPPAGVSLAVEKNIISVEGADKQQVGEMAASIRAVRKPEPYKGKGIRYIDEIIRRKAGKTAAKTAA